MMSRSFLLVLMLLVPVLSGCRYNMVPLIPKPVGFQLPARITGATLTREGEELVLRAQLDGQFSPGYLKANWFNNSEPLAEDSVYVDKDDRRAVFHLKAPQPGAYRAVLSFEGAVLRQVELYEVEP